MDVCQTKIPGFVRGHAIPTHHHESELIFTARWSVEVTFAIITGQLGLRLWGITTACNSRFCWLTEKLTGHLQLAWNSSEPPWPKHPT